MRRMRFMGADKWWSNQRFGDLLTLLGGFPVSRGTADREALKRCIALLEGGEPLVLFPEGERKSGPFVQPLFEGAAYIAMKTGASIVPVGIGGSERAMPKGARFIYPRKLQVIVGKPISVPVMDTPKLQRDATRQVTMQLHEELQRLFDIAQARVGH
jgi:1-acyl-sn-glycerol-3-phosphate acyltransferase